MIIKSFDEEIELLDKIELPNKLQLFSLYEDLYRFLVTSFEDDKLKLEYSDFFVNTFIDVLNNLAEDSNINNIMQEFIKKIKLNKYSNLTPLINYIDMFEFNLDEIIQMMTEASIIDDTNYPYKLKIILLEIFKNFTGAIIYNLDSFYDSDAVNLFGLKLMNKLKSNLESILSQDISYFKKNLLLEAKDILIEYF